MKQYLLSYVDQMGFDATAALGVVETHAMTTDASFCGSPPWSPSLP
jgi:hypothetical protein